MTEEKPNVKTTLTKDDAAGWYLASVLPKLVLMARATTCPVKWTGSKFYGDDEETSELPEAIFELTNFRRLVESPVTNEAARQSPGAKGFTECDTCRAKPGTPYLCSGCLANRALIMKLQESPVTNEAAREQSKIAAVTAKLERYKRILIENQDFCGAASVKDCLQLLNGFEPKLLKLADDEKATLQQTIARQSDEIEELKAERDQLHKTRESLAGEIERLRKLLREALEDWYYDMPNPSDEAIQTADAVKKAIAAKGAGDANCS